MTRNGEQTTCLSHVYINADEGEQMPWGEGFKNQIEYRVGFIGREKTLNVYEQGVAEQSNAPGRFGRPFVPLRVCLGACEEVAR